MASYLQKKAARFRETAAEFKQRAEQEASFSKRETFFGIHQQLLRLAIVCEEDTESPSA